MADQEKDKQMDEMLDTLLAAYSSAEPRPGLETRILANLRDASGREASPTSWKFRWLWAGAVATIAALVFAVLVFRTVEKPHPLKTATDDREVQQAASASKPALASSSAPAATKRSTVQSLTARREGQNANRQAVNLAIASRPAIFPTPVPLSEQERLMFTYLANTPQEVVVAQMQRNDQKEAEAFWEDR
jgi:hypothetical protein